MRKINAENWKEHSIPKEKHATSFNKKMKDRLKLRSNLKRKTMKPISKCCSKLTIKLRMKN